jgi:hypothetical protein
LQYLTKNVILNDNIKQYLKKAKRACFCACLDGCANPKKCPCYKQNSKLQNPTYTPHIDETGKSVVFQVRASLHHNKVFNYNECHPSCGCNKDVCFNFLTFKDNLKQFKFLIKRVSKKMATESNTANVTTSKDEREAANVEGTLKMWGLFALEDIPSGAFLMEYRGEVLTKKQGDMRGSCYDANGLSYLFDMNDPEPNDARENLIQKVYFNEFFPLCIDAMFYGNEARFINHSCDPNVQSFNLSGAIDS